MISLTQRSANSVLPKASCNISASLIITVGTLPKRIRQMSPWRRAKRSMARWVSWRISSSEPNTGSPRGPGGRFLGRAVVATRICATSSRNRGPFNKKAPPFHFSRGKGHTTGSISQCDCLHIMIKVQLKRIELSARVVVPRIPELLTTSYRWFHLPFTQAPALQSIVPI